MPAWRRWAFAAVGVLHYLVSGPERVSGARTKKTPKRLAGESLTMAAYDVEQGDAVHPGDPVIVDRYTEGARVNHWITATCLVLLALSGLALFYPSFFFLTALFGGGEWTRTIHPWIGVVLFFSFSGLFLRFWKANLWRAEDGTWLARLRDVLTDDEDKLPEVGKYNAGQKVVFWAMSVLILILISTGIVIWDQYFYPLTSIEQKRMGDARPLARRGYDHLRLDRTRLCGDLAARHDSRHDARAGHRRLGLEASSQMV